MCLRQDSWSVQAPFHKNRLSGAGRRLSAEGPQKKVIQTFFPFRIQPVTVDQGSGGGKRAEVSPAQPFVAADTGRVGMKRDHYPAHGGGSSAYSKYRFNGKPLRQPGRGQQAVTGDHGTQGIKDPLRSAAFFPEKR